MATVSNNPAPVTVALLPGKPETRMRLSTIIKKEREEQKEQDKKLDNHQKQPQSSTVVNISARAKELNRTEPVGQTSSAVKSGNSTDKAINIPAKDKEVSRAAPVAQPSSAVNTGNPAAPAAPAVPEKKA